VRRLRKIHHFFSGEGVRKLLSAAAYRASVLLNNYFLFEWELRLRRQQLKRQRKLL
jgi:hypothetical protein